MNIFRKKKNKFDTPRRRQMDSDSDPGISSDNAFRRNRTISGASAGFDYAAGANSDITSSRQHVHHLTNKRRKVAGLFLVVLLSTLVLWSITSNMTARVAISVPGQDVTKQIDSAIYETIIQDYLNSNPAGRLNFFLDQKGLNNYVIQKAPEVANVSLVGMSSVGQTEFAIRMRIPVAGWRISDKQYYVDSKGISFERNYFADPAVQVVDNSGANLGSGTAIVSNRLLGFVGKVVSISKSYNYTVTQATLPVNTTRQLDIKIKGIEYYVKLSIDRPVGEQIEDMDHAIKHIKKNSLRPSYCDVRVSGKAYYK